MSEPAVKFSRPFGYRAALVIVNVQNDFCKTNGAIPSSGTKELIEKINKLRSSVSWDLVILARDWHPKDHISFFSSNIAERADMELFKPCILADGTSQMIWPDHCVQGSEGAEFPTALLVDNSEHIIDMGSARRGDSSSAFYETSSSKSDVAKLLRQASIRDVYIAGAGAEFGVLATSQDSLKDGFSTIVVEDCITTVVPSKHKQVVVSLEQKGARIINSQAFLNQLAQEDPRQLASDYLSKHNIPQLLEKLCTALVLHKPADPRVFLIQEVAALKKEAANTNPLSFLTDKDLATMFNMLDPIGKGSLTKRQVEQALKGLSLRPSATLTSSTAATFNLAEFKNIITTASAS